MALFANESKFFQFDFFDILYMFYLSIIDSGKEQHTMSDQNSRIAKIISGHINPKTLSILKQGIKFPIDEYALKQQIAIDTPEKGPLAELMTGLMQALRAENLVHACPNNGPREVRAMAVWNEWVKTGNVEKGDDFHHRHVLFNSTGFGFLKGSLHRNFFLFREKQTQSEKAKKNITSPDSSPPDFSESDFDSVLSQSAKDLIKGMTGNPLITPFLHFHMGHYLYCHLTEKPLSFGDNPLRPMLMENNTYGERKALPILKTPKIARHMILELPSQTLVMADWFRIKGFREGLIALVGHDNHAINCANGLDERMRDYIEKAGLAIVQVFEMSPEAYSDKNGIWRMGYINQEHETFLGQDGYPTDISPPEPLWETCTDIWANCLADRQIIVDILMASKLYGNRKTAGEILDAYIENTFGANSIAMPNTERLHIYAPTGYAVEEKFSQMFQADEIEQRDWQKDGYILSVNPLNVPEHLLETEILHGPKQIALKNNQRISGEINDINFPEI